MRYLPGILLAQIVSALMLWLNRNQINDTNGWLLVLLPSIAVALAICFWFGSMSRRLSSSIVEKAKQEHLREREELRVKAEQAKAKVQRDAHKSIARESRRTHSKANFKVGAALTGAVAFGVLMMFTQLASLGLILLSGAGGALAGYMGRMKQQNKPLSSDQVADLPSVNADKSKRISLPRFGRKRS